MRPQAVERLDYGQEDFCFIRTMMKRQAGINLGDCKQELVYSRLAKRVRQLGFSSFRHYCQLLGQDKEEVLHCINAMTTNVTSFFRESHHFDFLKTEVLGGASEGIRIWSAGCSTGEEPYSIAFTCADAMALNPSLVPTIVATDLDSNVVAHGRQGIYPAKSVADLNPADLRRWFLRGKGARSGAVKVQPEVQQLVNFSQLNLKDSWEDNPALSEPFDVIFCRNVMIYFDNDFRAMLLQRFFDRLKPGGYLMLGHSESLFGLATGFKVVGKTIHQKREG